MPDRISMYFGCTNSHIVRNDQLSNVVFILAWDHPILLADSHIPQISKPPMTGPQGFRSVQGVRGLLNIEGNPILEFGDFLKWGQPWRPPNHQTLSTIKRFGPESKLCMERSAVFRTYGTKGLRNWSCSGPLECDEI